VLLSHGCGAAVGQEGDGRSHQRRGSYVQCRAGAEIRFWQHRCVCRHCTVWGESLHILTRRVHGPRYRWQGIGRSGLVPFNGSFSISFLDMDIPFRGEGLQLLERVVLLPVDLVLKVGPQSFIEQLHFCDLRVIRSILSEGFELHDIFCGGASLCQALQHGHRVFGEIGVAEEVPEGLCEVGE